MYTCIPSPSPPSTLSQLRELLDSGTVSLTYTLPSQLFTMLNTLIFLNDEVNSFICVTCTCDQYTVFMLIERKLKVNLRDFLVKVISHHIKMHYEKYQNAHLIRSCV